MQEYPTPDLFLFDEEETFSGKVKQKVTDYQVSELLKQDASGTGPNTYIRVQKDQMTTVELIRILADYLDRAVEDFCVADYKGRRSVDIQWVSLEHLDPRDLDNFEHDQIEIIQITRDDERLSPVDLDVNRFEIIVRDVDEDARVKAKRILKYFSDCGVPNWFASQSFGARMNRHLLGWALVKRKWGWFIKEFLCTPAPGDTEPVKEARKLAGDGEWAEALEKLPETGYVPERAVLKSLKRYSRNQERATAVIPEDYRRGYLFALQAYAFNRFLAERLDSFDELAEGDVAFMHGSAGCFPVVDPEDEQPRLDRFAISPTGPMFGEKFLGASGNVEQLEDEVLSRLDLSYEDFQRSRYPVPGRRRPLRAPISQVRVQNLEENDLEVGFCLPHGCEGMVVLEELLHERIHYPGDEV